MDGMAVIECPTTISCHRSTDTETPNLWTSKNWAVMLFVRLWRNMVSVPQWKAEQTRVPKFFTTDVVWVTAPNAFAAETKALDEYRAEQAKKSNKNNNSSTVDALPKVL
jgi:hypothetical protein